MGGFLSSKPPTGVIALRQVRFSELVRACPQTAFFFLLACCVICCVRGGGRGGFDRPVVVFVWLLVVDELKVQIYPTRKCVFVYFFVIL